MAIVYLTTHYKKPVESGDRPAPQTPTCADSAKPVSGNEDEIPISRAMIEAGLDEFWKFDLEDGAKAAICAVYRAMYRASKSAE
jgi:hypothetical protein